MFNQTSLSLGRPRNLVWPTLFPTESPGWRMIDGCVEKRSVPPFFSGVVHKAWEFEHVRCSYY